MRIIKPFTAIVHWLFVFCSILALTGMPVRVYAEGGYVVDPAISVPANSYTTFSTVYNGKRYYLGVDTTAAKSGKDTITVYDAPCYAAMWIAGPLWSPTGEILPRKNYTRTVKSVWLAERASRDRYLAIGQDKGTYSSLMLANEAGATMWYTAKDFTVQSQHMYGYVYYFSDASGVDIYRYVTYDPLFGFSRLYSSQPAVSQLISVWDRKTGNDVTCTLTPSTYTFGYEPDNDTTRLHITSQVHYYEDVDRFRSRFNQVDIWAKEPREESRQSVLVGEPYNLSGYYEWKSNPRVGGAGASYNGSSYMKFWGGPLKCIMVDDDSDPSTPEIKICYQDEENPEWLDSTVLWVSDSKYTPDYVNNVWHDTIFAIGTSPFNVWAKDNGDGEPTKTAYADHSDWLYQHFYVKGEHFVDSILIVRETFHNHPFTTLTSTSSPNVKVFDYSESELEQTFNVSARYKDGNNIVHANEAIEATSIGDERTLILNARTTYRDTIWTEKPAYSDIVLYDTLLVEALLADGTTTAIWSEGHDERWIKSVELTARNQIKVVVKPFNSSANENRKAQIRYTYRYRHSAAEDDWAETKRSIWITQKTKTATDSKLYSFHHAAGRGNTESPTDLQPVHEKNYVMYAIPGKEMQLPLHTDHWGYYRWFSYNPGEDNHDKDPLYGTTWEWNESPKNHLADASSNEFMPINPATDGSSRGQWDMSMGIPNHFTVNVATPVPTINYPESNSKTGIIACDVSAYTDIAKEGDIGTSLTSLTEPTLSYRNLFDIRPAKDQADKMATCRIGGNWMETYDVIVPANRPFTLQQQYPTNDAASYVVEDLLQYIYYFNPTGTPADANMGIKGASPYNDDTKAISYGRIGKVNQVGDDKRTAQLLTKTDLDTMSNGSSKQVIIVNARQGSGYVLGKRSGEETLLPGDIYGCTTVSVLADTLKNQYLNPNTQGAYVITLTKTKSGVVKLTHKESPRGMWFYYTNFNRIVRWIQGKGHITGTDELEYSCPAISDANRITGGDASCIKFYMHYTGAGAHGYLTACNSSYQPDLDCPSSDGEVGSEANRRWFIFEIKEPDATYHSETPVWYKSSDGTTWTDTVAWLGGHDDGYELLADGHLHISENVLKTFNSTTWYALKTEHFQLAKFKVTTRDPEKEGPTNTTLIREDDILNNYDILYSLGTEGFPAPNTDEVTTPYHHMPWSYCELSYHYPRTSDAPNTGGTHFISDSYRIYDTDLPAKGEYCYINKFDNGSGDVVSCMAGAEYGYMLCVNAAQKPTTIFDFEYPQLPCSDQELYLTADLCNPVENSYNPQVTADLDGWNGSKWVSIYRFKTGEIPYDASRRWFQMVLPIDRTKIASYQKFRCTASIPGTTETNAYILIDRVRFIAKARPVSVFQNKTTCLDGGNVDIVARVDYTHSSFPAGTLVAFQYQKLNKSTHEFEPMVNKTQVLSTYFIEGMSPSELEGDSEDSYKTWLRDVNGNACGMIVIPDNAYNPVTQTNLTTRRNVIHAIGVRMGENDAEATTRANTYVNESTLVRDLDEVPGHLKSYVNEGTTSQPYYTMFLSAQVPAAVGDSFRVAMTAMPSVGTVPNFSTSGCATERVLTIKNPVTLHVNGANEAWHNKTRAELEASSAAPNPVPANETYFMNITLENLPSDAVSGSEKCLFDILYSAEDDRDYDAKVRTMESTHAKADSIAVETADAWFKARYGLTRTQFNEVMNIFRADHEKNPNRTQTNWNNVQRSDFTWSGRSPEQADTIFRLLDRLITKERKLEIGVPANTLFLGSNQDSYAYVLPVPATGTYIQKTSGDTISIAVCNTPLWFEIHSASSEYSLRFGFDNKVDGNYQIPVIRATKTDANTSLKVRLADITHSSTTSGVVIGWDSTYVIESNDPEWNPATKTFRYHQDRIVQERLFDNYYRMPRVAEGDIDNRYVIFTPINKTYVNRLEATNCDCYDYDPAGTTYDANATTGVFKTPESAVTNCNEWHVKFQKLGEEGDSTRYTPGYHKVNNIKLKAGYWYKFKTAFFDVSGGNRVLCDAGGDGTCRGHAEFILAIAPDTVRWTPSHPESANYWNDDNNWTAVVNGVDFHSCIASIPMGDSRVIIPKAATENQLPIVETDSALVARRVDTLDYGFKFNTCKDILFYPEATMWKQHNLDYNKAYVDVVVKTGNWQTFSPALDKIYTGDIYVPRNAGSGNKADDPDFAPALFEDGTAYSASFNRGMPYLFYQGFYNSSVNYVFQNTDLDGDPLDTHTRTSATSADWVRTNALDQELKPGHASIILGFGPTNAQDSALIVRLPKREDTYHYVGKKNGVYTAGDAVDMAALRGCTSAEITKNLAYDKTKKGNNAGIKYVLENEHDSKVFFFGNPTMALIDVYKLCYDNRDSIETDGGGFKFTAYQLRSGSTYTPMIVDGPGKYFVAPQKAVGLIATDAAAADKKLGVLLTPNAQVAMTGEGTDIHHPFSAPKRKGLSNAISEKKLYISATNERSDGEYKAFMTLGESPAASCGFVVGEDVLSLSSGNTYYNRQAFSTPLTMYTIADNKALMYDMRDSLGVVPVLFGTLEKVESKYRYSDVTLLSFALDGSWDRPLYLYDAQTNDSVLIVNGLQIGVQTPESDQIRYYINAGHAAQTHEQPGVATGFESVSPQDGLSSDSDNGLTSIYDVLGRKIMTLNEFDLLSNIQLPTGVYIIQRGNNAERMVIR